MFKFKSSRRATRKWVWCSLLLGSRTAGNKQKRRIKTAHALSETCCTLASEDVSALQLQKTTAVGQRLIFHHLLFHSKWPEWEIRTSAIRVTRSICSLGLYSHRAVCCNCDIANRKQLKEKHLFQHCVFHQGQFGPLKGRSFPVSFS